MSKFQHDNYLQPDCIAKLSHDDKTLQAVHECVHGSTIRHILKFPIEILIKYLSTFPFYRGADTLYYFLLKKFGSDVYYTSTGKHLVTIHPELLGVYVLAEQNLKAPITKDSVDDTIYPLIKSNIDRTITCERYQMRHSIIIGEASFQNALNIPSIALNIPLYQGMFHSMSLTPVILTSLVDNDCWEPIQSLNKNVFFLMLQRMAFTKGVYPNLWTLVLKEYYSQQLIRLNISDYLSFVATRQITALNNLFPDIVRLPPNLDTLGIRLWFASKPTRAYLLGFDISDGIPSDSIISERLYRLQQLGIEKYSDEITGIYLDTNKILTGKIGIMSYPKLIGKKLLNTKDMSGSSLGSYYPQDLYPIINKDTVFILTRSDIEDLVPGNTVTYQGLVSLLVPNNIPKLVEPPNMDTVREIFDRLTCNIPIKCGVPVRTKLVETMSWDILNC